MESKYKGMTVNERLYLSGLIDDFDRAVVKKDIEIVVKILNKIEIIDELSVKNILQSLDLME
ncbi:hypothetical protein [Myroides odoratus]|uniref:hypothetical protein n=1 Tax=Myroides odoratus TaxID=256 RepID=UPI0039B0BFB6